MLTVNNYSIYAQFGVIWGHKFTSFFENQETLDLWEKTWGENLKNIDHKIIKSAIDHATITCKWPPSIAEFLEICEKVTGMPDVDDAYQKAIKREFDHPIIQRVFNAIGSWFFQNGSEKELRQRFESEYKKIREIMRQDSILKIENLN